MIDAKILVVILKDEYGDPRRGESYEYNYFFRTLQRMYAECRLFDYGPFLRRTSALQSNLLRTAQEFMPDLIFFTLYEDQFEPETLDRLKEHHLTINWFCDDQWRFETFSSRYCHHFSHVVTTDPYAVKKYREAGYSQAILSQWATRDCVPQFADAGVDYLHDVSFVGAMNPFRRWLVGELGKRAVSVTCFGHGWPTGRVTYERMEEIIRGSRINLNISNSRSYDIRYVLSSFSRLRTFRSSPKTKEQIKGRHFEINALGGFQLTNYVEFLEDYFWLGKEIAIYNALDDLVDKIRYYLDHDDLRCSIARAGYERVRREHTYERRFANIFARIGLAPAGRDLTGIREGPTLESFGEKDS